MGMRESVLLYVGRGEGVAKGEQQQLAQRQLQLFFPSLVCAPVRVDVRVSPVQCRCEAPGWSKRPMGQWDAPPVRGLSVA